MNYYLSDGTPTEDLLRWEVDVRENHRVADDTVAGVRVSTVFLGMDHQWGDGPPLIYETMTFAAGAEVCRRYSTVEQAEAGHAEVCALVRRTVWRWKVAGVLARWSRRLARWVGGEHYLGGAL